MKSFEDEQFTLPIAANGCAFSVLQLVIYAIWIAGVIAELFAIYALYQQRASMGTDQGVLLSAMFLILAVAAGPVVTHFQSINLLKLAEELEQEEKAAEKEPAAEVKQQPGSEQAVP